MTDPQPEPKGHMHVEREKDVVVLRFDGIDTDEPMRLPPEGALELAFMLQNAAMDAKRYRPD